MTESKTSDTLLLLQQVQQAMAAAAVARRARLGAAMEAEVAAATTTVSSLPVTHFLGKPCSVAFLITVRLSPQPHTLKVRRRHTEELGTPLRLVHIRYPVIENRTRRRSRAPHGTNAQVATQQQQCGGGTGDQKGSSRDAEGRTLDLAFFCFAFFKEHKFCTEIIEAADVDAAESLYSACSFQVCNTNS